MNWIRSLILVAVAVTFFLLALRRLRTYRLKERYALLFVFLGLPFLVLAFWGDGILWVADLLHMEYFTVMLLCVSMFLILTVFELLTIVSQQDRRIATLAQMVGILMEKHKRLEQAQATVPAAEQENPEAPAVVAAPAESVAAAVPAPPPAAPALPRRPERETGVRPEMAVTVAVPRRPRAPVGSSD